MEFLIEYGYAGLFFGAFLAATILPLSSEVILTVLLLNHWDPYLLILTATAGNVLGSILNYFMGYGGRALSLQRWWRLSTKDLKLTEKRFKRYGIYSLLFAWVPVIGDPLTVIAGFFRINFLLFFLLVGAGKMVRYIVLTFSVLRFI